MQDLWNVFTQSGKIEDYLKYKEAEQQEGTNANDGERFNYQRTDDRRE